MKTPHDVDPTTMKTKAKKAAVGAAVTIAVLVSAGAVPHDSAMKMHHDCCVWTAPVR